MTRWTSADLAKLNHARRVASPAGNISANALTKFVLSFLEVQGVEAWRDNTMGVFDVGKAAKLVFSWLKGGRGMSLEEIKRGLRGCYRKSHERKGKADISGYHRKIGGVAVFVEVKVGRDELSPEQKWHLSQAKRAGCIALVARNEKQFVEEWAEAIRPYMEK